MKRLIAFLLTGLLIAASLGAQTSVWEISRDGKILYLGGSLHILREEDYPLPAAFDRALERADIAVFEADIGEMETPEFAEKMMYEMILPEEDTLYDLLSPETFEQLALLCESFEIPIDQLIYFKPPLVTNILTLFQMESAGLDAPGVDLYVFAAAEMEEKQLGYLESTDFQIDLLANEGMGFEDEYISSFIAEWDTALDDTFSLLSAWETGDGKAVDSMLRKMYQQSPQSYETMIAERNRNWLPLIEEYLNGEETAFVVVGLAHMYGPDGLLAELNSLGYHIRQAR
ncbi:TraB/GumN family protein [Brucepastera parasyntrophica]|uniref:TraB/GumN family protein n=1 Tax=Brucepastera parasyntrophica TaxID=2880008 RepID=UPI0021087315|nr:TraB/GumN family protein [Brucepastera parasyntrophica]ULQ58487.1 TraB/GumN family protein [Brucepastera parasyntrophica]